MPFPCPLVLAGESGCGKHTLLNKISVKDHFIVYNIPNKLKLNKTSSNQSLNEYLFNYYNSKMIEISTCYHVISIFSSISNILFSNNNSSKIDTWEILKNTCNSFIQNISRKEEESSKANENDEMKIKFNYSNHMFDKEGGGVLENYYNPEYNDNNQFDPILHDFPLPSEEELSTLNSEEKIKVIGKELETLDSNMIFKLPSDSMKIIISITSDNEDMNNEFINKIMNENNIRSVIITTIPFIQDSIKNVFNY